MKTLKKALALLLAVMFVLSMAACHPKDEAAITAGDYVVTSAMYSYYLTMADLEAKSLIEANEEYDTKAAGFSYYKQKIDNVPYEEYVKNKALENSLRYLALEKLCKDAKLEIPAEDIKGMESTADYYWNYSYGYVLMQNGVSFETYKKIFMNDALYSEYFDYLYGAEGEKAVDAESLKTALTDNYSAVYMITHDYSKETEPDVDAISESLNKYVTALKEGTAYADVLAQYNADNKTETSSDTTSSTTTSSNASETTSSEDASETTSSDATSSEEATEEKKAQDSNIKVLTKYEETYTGEATLFTKYEDVEKLGADEVALIHDEDAKAYYIVVKKDITADEYYLETLSDEIRYLLKSEEFDTLLKETAEKLDYTAHNYAINQFKVKKIYDGSDLNQ
ncbi:MAG: hypothetical protein IIX54_02330 [Clostridia bacterium]|nr:hypothetical protein [Clostridia bacterium]